MAPIKVSDYIAQFWVDRGVDTVYMVTGGGAMHLNHSFSTHPLLQVLYNHHEQACAMAAESHARLCGKPALVNVTTGPGGINTINGVYGAWTDSVPMVVVTGQVRFDTTLASTPLPLRQLGDQEVDIVGMVTGITKYAAMVKNADDIRYHLERAASLVNSGRPGPVWLDVPMNVQGATVDPDILRGFDAPPSEGAALDESVLADIVGRLRAAKRPVLMVGGGIRASGMHREFLTLIDQLKIPVVTGFNAHDVLENAHPYYAGRPGSVGDRGGNFVVQNSDVLLVLGSRLNIRQVSYNWVSFAREAYKIMVDVDAAELHKPTLTIDHKVHADLRVFIPALTAYLSESPLAEPTSWVTWCRERVAKYPVVLPAYWETKDTVNPYCFMQTLSQSVGDNQIVVTADGTACVVSFQAWEVKSGQRMYSNSGSASMGYELPAAIGACLASGLQHIICLAGDGSIQMNIQELATIVHNKLPIKIFWLNNNGYHSIRQTQRNFFGRFDGVGPESGVGIPDPEKLAYAYGLPFMRCSSHDQLAQTVSQFLSAPGFGLCEVVLDQAQDFSPKLSSKRLADGRMVSSPLEDMAPFLSDAELESNMIIPMEKRI